MKHYLIYQSEYASAKSIYLSFTSTKFFCTFRFIFWLNFSQKPTSLIFAKNLWTVPIASFFATTHLICRLSAVKNRKRRHSYRKRLYGATSTTMCYVCKWLKRHQAMASRRAALVRKSSMRRQKLRSVLERENKNRHRKKTAATCVKICTICNLKME